MSFTDPVRILVQPASQKISVGQTAIFTVSIAPVVGAVLSYQWTTNNPRFAGSATHGGLGPGELGIGVPAADVSSLIEAGPWPAMILSYIEPGGAIPGATAASYTTPVAQLDDNGTQLTCYIIQVVTISQSIGNPPLTVPIQSFSNVSTQTAILLVSM